MLISQSDSVVENVEEALVELLLPKDALRCHTQDHQTLVRTGVDIEELAFLRLEVRLARAGRVILRHIQLVCHSHVHLDLNASEVYLVVFVAHHQVLIAVVPEKRMGLHLDELVSGSGSLALRVILEALHMVKLDRNDGARLGILDLKGAIEDADLQPMVAIELRDQVTSLVAEGKLLAVAREHDLRDVHAEELALLGLAERVEQDIVDSAFSAAHDSLSAILVEEHGLILHVDLLLQLQVLLAKDQDLALQGHIDVRRGAHRTENLHSLTLTVDCCNQA